jgi:hypothetical protein
MDIWSAIGVVALFVAYYAIYRIMTVNSVARLAEHDKVNDEIVATLTECSERAKYFVERLSDRGYVITQEGINSTEQEKNVFVAQLKAVDQCITDQLSIDSKNLWRIRTAAQVKVVGRNKMWRYSQLRMRIIISVITRQYDMSDMNR